ncbi:putative lipoyltransferase 2, mitochondrial [Modicella reniformis]|uniref:lipoyl(octanoyl) transferase n=1 Tax=Modicella reniformis TaxID=1440133 RepID=A0A9P6SP08_9FUNG|nr:putative lipoyltransferase 2, mitochondrial [Modicella reniformis]
MTFRFVVGINEFYHRRRRDFVGIATMRDDVMAANTTASATAAGLQEPACPTTIARPLLSPLPYIYLRDLPYNRSTELQKCLVERRLQLRKEAKLAEACSNSHNNNSRNSYTDTPFPVEDGRHDLILLVEHTPTYTNGRRNRGAISEQEVARLEGLGAKYVESLRGGEITFHGPGQLVAYPMLDLKATKLSTKCYISYLERAIMATCAEWGVKTIKTENTGVWINDQKKIAAIGVQVQRYITSHGLGLNCNTNLDFFKEIIACGLVGKGTTSLSQELKDPSIDVQKVIPAFLKSFGISFNRTLKPLSEVNPELERVILEFVQNGFPQ